MGKTVFEVLELFALCLIAVLVLLGNVLVILAFLLGPRSIRTYTNYFVVNLAVSDLGVGCISLPFWIVNRADPSLISKDIYSFFITLDILFGTSSILSLAAISLERMYAVKFPTKHFNLSVYPVMAVIIISWSIGMLLTGLKFAMSLKIYTAFIFVLAFCIPSVIIIVCYCIIFHAAVKMMKASNQTGKLTREIHVAKTVSVIISLFIFCWLPFFVVNMIYIYCKENCDDKPIWPAYLTKLIHYSNSMMNFFVYAVRSPDFRRSFKAILFKCDTSGLRERIRTFSESIASIAARSRTSSERQSFLNDNQHNHQADDTHNGNHIMLEHKPRIQKLRFNTRNSHISFSSFSSEHSIFENDVSPSSTDSPPYLQKIGEITEDYEKQEF